MADKIVLNAEIAKNRGICNCVFSIAQIGGTLEKLVCIQRRSDCHIGDLFDNAVESVIIVLGCQTRR